jgi:hypothetical protein
MDDGSKHQLTNPSRQLRALLPRGLGRQRSRDECKIYGVNSCKFKDKMTTKRYQKCQHLLISFVFADFAAQFSPYLSIVSWAFMGSSR